MANVQRYYIVPQQVYEKVYQDTPSLMTKISSLPASSRQKAQKLLTHLHGQVSFDEFGRAQGFKQNIYDYVNFAVRGKDQPIDWDQFVLVLLDAPKEIFTEKINGEIRLARKNAR